MEELLTHLSSAQALGHLAYTLIFFSFLVKRMLWLRLFMIVASFASIIYNAQIAAEPLWTPIQWNVLFIITNVYHITKIILENRKIPLNIYEELMHKNTLSNLTTAQLKKVTNIGFTRTYPSGDIIIEDKEQLEGLYCVVKGTVEILSDGKHITYLKQGQFVGEMSFLTNSETSATVRVTEDSVIHIWPKAELKDFLNRNSDILSHFHASIGHQMVNIIVSQNQKIKEESDIKIAA